MNEHKIVRSMLLYLVENASAETPIAKSLKLWALNNLSWLNLGVRKKKLKDWEQLIKALEQWEPSKSPAPYAIQLANGLGKILPLNRQNRKLLRLLIAFDRLPRVSAVARIASAHGIDTLLMLGELAGADHNEAQRFVRRSPILRLGLVSFCMNRNGMAEVELKWALTKLLNHAPEIDGKLIEALVGPKQTSSLRLDDFQHVGDADYLCNLIRGAGKNSAEGINILIHGPPGTGKTELACTLAHAADATLHAVGEVDDYDEEPSRYDRVNALSLAQSVLKGRKNTFILFDEMEDFIGDAEPATGGWMTNRSGSKVFTNRLIENNTVPIIWTTNAIGNIDDAIIRRMSYVLKLDYPSRATSKRIYENVAKDVQIATSAKVEKLIETAPEAATILRTATQAARLAGMKTDNGQSAISLVKALRGGQLPLVYNANVDLSLYQTEPPLAPLFERIASGEILDVSLLLTGPPGTGKTALAHHFARKINRPLLEKRASELLSKWVGETETNIANAFLDARANQGVLFFDEADSLMFDRSAATANWQVGQVNELLSWLDRHDFPVLAATNNASRLDPATLRRFDFKVELKPLGQERAGQAFQKFFAISPPAGLAELQNLTPGDFAVVKRQLRHCPDKDGEAILASLRQESELKPERSQRIGF